MPESEERLIGVDDALSKVLSAFSPLAEVPIPILEARGLVLARDVISTVDLPPFSNSAMDGYAVKSSDTLGASDERPIILRVVAELAAGASPGIELTAGAAIRIMTGAPIPIGADAVIRFEDTDEGSLDRSTRNRLREKVLINRGANPGDNVRSAAEDVSKGEVVLSAGTILQPPKIGLLAALNVSEAPVHKKPRVAILATGDEIVDLGQELCPGQIRNSNSAMLAAMAASFGAEPLIMGIARDSVADLTSRLEVTRAADLIVTSGGVSLGDYDMVKDVLRAEGEISIWQVRMKPGKPMAFGRIDDVPLLGVSGNPVAAAVSFLQFGRPAIRKMLGHRNLTIPTIEATLTVPIDNRGHRRNFVRVVVEGSPSSGYEARLAGDQGAGVLTSLVRANGLLVIPEDLEMAAIGSRHSVQMFDWNQ